MSSFYLQISSDQHVEQGDIFTHLPFLTLDSTKINEIVPEGKEIKFKEIDLKDFVGEDDNKNLVIKAKIKPGIVITQNCDLLRKGHLSFCAIRRYQEVEKNFTTPTLVKQVKFLTKDYAARHKYFYLPPDMPNGFSERMAVDFSTIHQIKIDLLEELITKRLCRLGPIPLEHFKIKLGNYFKRFAYDPWYVLNKDEYQAYLSQLDEDEKQLTKPYPWND